MFDGSLDFVVHAHAKLLQLCLILFYPMDWSQPGSFVHGILQARILEWVAISSSEELPDSGIKPASLTSPALAGGFFTTSATWEATRFCLLQLRVKFEYLSHSPSRNQANKF